MRWVSQGQLVGELMGSGVGDLKGIQVLETGESTVGSRSHSALLSSPFLSNSENHLHPSSEQTPKNQIHSMTSVLTPSFLFPSVHVDSCLLF